MGEIPRFSRRSGGAGGADLAFTRGTRREAALENRRFRNLASGTIRRRPPATQQGAIDRSLRAHRDPTAIAEQDRAARLICRCSRPLRAISRRCRKTTASVGISADSIGPSIFLEFMARISPDSTRPRARELRLLQRHSVSDFVSDNGGAHLVPLCAGNSQSRLYQVDSAGETAWAASGLSRVDFIRTLRATRRAGLKHRHSLRPD